MKTSPAVVANLHMHTHKQTERLLPLASQPLLFQLSRAKGVFYSSKKKETKSIYYHLEGGRVAEG